MPNPDIMHNQEDPRAEEDEDELTELDEPDFE